MIYDCAEEGLSLRCMNIWCGTCKGLSSIFEAWIIWNWKSTGISAFKVWLDDVGRIRGRSSGEPLRIRTAR
jgi:hypothetical protein